MSTRAEGQIPGRLHGRDQGPEPLKQLFCVVGGDATLGRFRASIMVKAPVQAPRVLRVASGRFLQSMARKAHMNTPMVLVVDDQAGMQQYLRRALEMEYCAVETVSSGWDAIARVRTGAVPDLVLLDVEMPGLNGLDTLEELLRCYPELKIIMCSCRDDADTIGKAHTLGAREYLARPFRQVQLAAALQRCLG